MAAKNEIERVRAKTSDALDRIISTAQESSEVASGTHVKLVQQGKQIQGINAELAAADDILDSTDRKLKYGFGFKAFFLGGRVDEKPKKKNENDSDVKARRRSEPLPAPIADNKNYIANKNEFDDYDSKLDTIDKLLNDLGATAEGMNTELRAQAVDLETTELQVEKVKTKAATQSKGMAQRFGIK